ncbi:MAG: SMC-Scp complex subunit ScpB [Candidatus Omnitrophota bacterium]
MSDPVTNTRDIKKEHKICNGAKSVIEALLFASDRPVALERMKKVLDGFDTNSIRLLLEELAREYDSANRGFRIAEIAGGFQMITAPSFAPFLKKFYKERRVERLSRQALETLAIIAYKQPLTKGEIELLRNVNADGVLTSLLDKGLIRICGRKKSPGRPYVFGTTRHFLEYFGLKSLEELPKMEDFSKISTQT